MKKVIIFLGSLILTSACTKKSYNTMTVSGNIDGLKKGTLYFQKIQDSVLITIDSLQIKGDGHFMFSYEIENPELFYLYLAKADNNDINDRINFFGEKGEIVINTVWNTFDTNSEVTGSKSHEKYVQFQEMLSKFNTRDFVLAQESLFLNSKATQEKIDSIEKLRQSNLIRRYQYVLNFGLTNPESYVTPYVTLREASDANPKYLDSINKSLSKEVANSKYGKALNIYLESLK